MSISPDTTMSAAARDGAPAGSTATASGAARRKPIIVPDAVHAGMYRIQLPRGAGLSDLVNITRAKDAIAELMPSRRRS
jgi:hypothetical protein